MLQAPNEEPWVDVVVSCTIQDRLRADPLTPCEMPQSGSWDEPVPRPVVRLLLRLCLMPGWPVGLINENVPLTMKDDVGSLGPFGTHSDFRG